VRRRQLQDGRVLTFPQGCKHHDVAVWELKRVAMGINLIPIDLPETRNLRLDLPVG